MVAKFKKNDEVIVLAGKDKGKKGKIIKVYPDKDRIRVAGVNLVKKHTRPSQTSAGGIIQKEASIHASNVAHVDPKDGTATRIGVKLLKDGKKVRFAKKSGEVIDK